MVVGAILGVERLTARKIIGVGIAVLGVAAALAVGLAQSPPGSWRGELIMTGAVFCMAFYNVLSRPLMQRSSALGFLTVGMGAGAAVLVFVGLRRAALPRSTISRRRSGLPASISAPAVARSPSSCGSWHWRARRRPALPIR